MNCHQTLMFINFPMWVILEMGNPEVASFNTKSWSSMTWMMHRGTPMTSDNHDFSLFSIVTTDFPPNTSQFSQVFVQQKPKFSAVFPCFFSVLSPLCGPLSERGGRALRRIPAPLLAQQLRGHLVERQRLVDHGGTFAYLASLTLFSKVRTGKCETSWLLWRLNCDLDDLGMGQNPGT